jgi:hypothetical protein
MRKRDPILIRTFHPVPIRDSEPVRTDTETDVRKRGVGKENFRIEGSISAVECTADNIQSINSAPAGEAADRRRARMPSRFSSKRSSRTSVHRRNNLMIW